jgi:hypothetical protein
MATSDAVETPGTVEVVVAVGWRLPAAVESFAADLPGRCDLGTAVRKYMRLARPYDNEDSGVALHLSALGPLQRAGRICAGEGTRRRRSEASGMCGVLCVCGWFNVSGRLKQSITARI